jgi:hypothetical protein
MIHGPFPKRLLLSALVGRLQAYLSFLMTLVKTYSLSIAILASAIIIGTLMPHSAAAQVDAALVGSVGTSTVNLTVVKQVSGGSAVPSNFSLHVYKNATDVAGSPQAGSSSGTHYNNLVLSAGDSLQVVEEEGGPVGYDVSFSGDCNKYGDVFVGRGGNLSCTVTNTFVGTSTRDHHNHNNDITDILPLLLAFNGGLGGGGPIPAIIAPQPCSPCGSTHQQTAPTQVPGVPNTGAGGDFGSNALMLLLSLGGAATAALKLRRV